MWRSTRFAVGLDGVGSLGEVDLARSRCVGRGLVHVRPLLPAPTAPEVSRPDELGEDAPNLSRRHVDGVADVGRGEFTTEPPVLPGDRRRGVVPRLDDLALAHDEEVWPERGVKARYPIRMDDRRVYCIG